MGSEWVTRRIGDIAEVIGGGTPSTKDPSNFGGSIPWLTPKDLVGPHPRYVARGARNLSEKGLRSSSARLLPKNTVLLSTRAPIGYLAIAANPIATSQGFRGLVVKEGIDHEFVYYWLKAHIDELERRASGSTFKELSGSALKEIPIRLPVDRREQEAIARILGSLDDKIEQLRRMNGTLEAIARTIFKSWFVDFDPVIVNALRAGNPIPEKFVARAAHYRDNPDALGLPDAILSAFPNQFIDSGAGLIPDGWSVRALGEIVTLIGGGTPSRKTKEYWDGEIPWFTVRDAPGGSDVFVIDTERKITKAGLERSAARVVPSWTTIISARGTVGKVAIVGVPMAFNQSCYAVIPASGFGQLFIYMALRQALSSLRRMVHGAVFDTITRETFKVVHVCVPTPALIQRFDGMMMPIFQRILGNVQESQTLGRLRDAVLPKLVTGELCILDVEGFLREMGL